MDEVVAGAAHEDVNDPLDQLAWDRSYGGKKWQTYHQSVIKYDEYGNYREIVSRSPSKPELADWWDSDGRMRTYLSQQFDHVNWQGWANNSDALCTPDSLASLAQNYLVANAPLSSINYKLAGAIEPAFDANNMVRADCGYFFPQQATYQWGKTVFPHNRLELLEQEFQVEVIKYERSPVFAFVSQVKTSLPFLGDDLVLSNLGNVRFKVDFIDEEEELAQLGSNTMPILWRYVNEKVLESEEGILLDAYKTQNYRWKRVGSTFFYNYRMYGVYPTTWAGLPSGHIMHHGQVRIEVSATNIKYQHICISNDSKNNTIQEETNVILQSDLHGGILFDDADSDDDNDDVSKTIYQIHCPLRRTRESQQLVSTQPVNYETD